MAKLAVRETAYHFSSAICCRLMPPSINWLPLRFVSPDPSPLKTPLGETDATAVPALFLHSCRLAVCAFAPCTASPTVPAAPVWIAWVPVANVLAAASCGYRLLVKVVSRLSVPLVVIGPPASPAPALTLVTVPIPGNVCPLAKLMMPVLPLTERPPMATFPPPTLMGEL